MRYLIFILILMAAFLVGAFGFPQIVGTIKYRLNMKSSLFTIIFWIIILGFGIFSIFHWLEDYKAAALIGYAIAFILSLGTKPD